MKQTKQNKPPLMNRFQWNKVFRFLPAVIWMAVIFVLSARTGDQLGTVMPLFQRWLPFIQDFNWGHFVAYFVLAMTLDYGIGRKADRMWMKAAIVILCGIYGVTDEYHQSFVGGRVPDIIDLRNDIIGAAIWTAISAIPFVRNIWRRIAP